jgi:hypothetical protein
MTKNHQNQSNFIVNIQRNLSNTIDTILNHSYLELNALENLTLMAEELAIDKRKPLAGCQFYTNYLTKLAIYGLDAEMLAALLVDFPAQYDMRINLLNIIL